jgi:hypothetical protein
MPLLKDEIGKFKKIITIVFFLKKMQNIVDYYCNPKCNAVGWTMISSDPLIFVTL